MTATPDIARLRQTAKDLLARQAAGAPASEIYHPEGCVRAVQPFGIRQGPDAIDALWHKLRTAFPDLERRDLIFLAGENQPDTRTDAPRAPAMVATMGVFQGRFLNDLCDIPATGHSATLRYCEAHWIEGTRILQTTLMLDLADLMWQAGCWPFVRSYGVEGAWLPPASGDGLRYAGGADTGGALDKVLEMHQALAQFDGIDLDSMPMAQHWSPDFMWYGPAGIGTTRGLDGFRAHHQIPFLNAFPDRAGAGHYIRISDGDYAVTGGWPSVTGTHRGPFMGMPATGQRITMNVMDFYRLEDGLIAENWVPIDIIDMALQMGVDVFERVRHLTGRPRLTL